MRGLKVVLWIAATGCLLSVLGLFLPMSALATIGSVFGVDELPDSPLFIYAVRVMSATYVTIGVFFLILALDPARYGILVPFGGAASVFVGVVFAVAGLAAGIPVSWWIGDALFCGVTGILILIFQRRAKGERQAAQPAEGPQEL